METNILEPLRKAPAAAVRDAVGRDYSPALGPVAARSAAAACLEEPFRPALDEQVSFLVNGFWLIGRHRMLEWEARDGDVADALRALGHEVVSGAGGKDAGGGFDRAMLISRALGYAGDGDPAARLRDLARTLRPGGLALFHVLDRDRAWGLVRDFTAREGAAGIAFDPRRGEVTVRVRPLEVTGGGAVPGGRETVRAFNLGEVEALLASAGLALERAYGGWNGGSVEEEGELTGRILVVASKPRRAARRRTAAGRIFKAAGRRGKAGASRDEGGGGP